MKIKSSSGDVKVKNFSGKLDSNNASGNIKLESINAKVSANSDSGNIKGEDIKLTGEGHFNSGSGNIDVRLANPLIHDISANSGSGDAVLNFEESEISDKVVMAANKKNGKIKAPFQFDTVEEIGKRNREKIRKSLQIGINNITISISTGSGVAEIEL